MRSASRLLAPFAVASLALAVLAACGADDAPASSPEPAAGVISVSDATSRQPSSGQSVSAVYATVSNGTDADVTIVGASTPVTDRVELHETVAGDDGMMTMREVPDGFVVPAGGSFTFVSGGPHIMLFDIDPATYPTDVVPMTLQFDGADPVTFDAKVMPLDDMGDMGDMSSMDHDDGHMSEGSVLVPASDMGDDMDHHDMGDDMDHDAMDHEAMDDDTQMLHELDDELSAGTIEPDRQRALIAPLIEHLTMSAPADGTVEADLLNVLTELDGALAAGDVATAAGLAFRAHELAHDLGHG